MLLGGLVTITPEAATGNLNGVKLGRRKVVL